MQTPADTPDRAKVEEFQRKHRIALLTMLFTDLVGSTKLKQTLGERAAIALIERHDDIVRASLREFPDAEEISTAGDSFFCVFAKPSDAVQFALILQHRLRHLTAEVRHPISVRVGIHVGEVFVQQRTEAARDFFGLQIDTTSRIQSLAGADQILMSRFAFDNARQILRGHELADIGDLSWLNHGTYALAGVEDSVEICEVGEVDGARLMPPADGAKVRRTVAPNAEPVLGWRPAAGQTIPGTAWLLERPLGEGGFGEVWVALHNKLKHRRVVKFCFKADRVRSLRREVTLFRVLQERVGEHRGIVAVHDVFFDEPPFYLIMEYVDGLNLAEWAAVPKSLGEPTPTARLEIVARVAEALQAAHEAGIIHRDVKPTNILVAEEEGRIQEVKLTDFGIGQVMSGEVLAGITGAGFTNTMLSSSSATGTPLYMAPELLAGKPASAQSDIYSLGVLLYQMLVGDLHRPLATDWPDEIADPLVRADVRRCVAGDPSKRFAQASELAANLHALDQRQVAWEAEAAAAAARERKAYRKGLLRASAIGAAILAFVLLLAFQVLHQSRRAERHARAEAAAKAEVSKNLTGIMLDRSEDLLTQDDLAGGLAYLAAALRAEPENRDTAERLLAALRDRNWALPEIDNARLDGPIQSLEYSADGAFVLATTHHSAFVIESKSGNIRSGPLNAEFSFSSFAQLAGHFSQDAQRVVLYSVDAQVFDAASGKPLTKPLAHPNRRLVASDTYPNAEFCPDGSILATFSTESSVAVWKLGSAAPTPFLIQSRSNPHCMAFSPDGKLLAIGFTGGELYLWSNLAEKTIAEGRNENDAAIEGVYFSPDSATLYTTGGHARSWRVNGKALTNEKVEGSILVSRPRDITFAAFPLERNRP
jgi:serine/threonine protein kinase/class 3 adenylate cyclase